MRIGVLGGTFDPVHRGHLQLAAIAQKSWGLAKVLFVPAFSQPLKQRHDVVDSRHRLAMLRLAIGRHPHWEVSDIEILRGGKSFTFDTITELHKRYPGDEFFFITGADCVRQFGSWHKFPELIRLCHFIIFSREGFEENDFNYLEKMVGKDGLRLLKSGMTEIFPIPISSTMIRAGLQTDKYAIEYLPNIVLSYIRSHKLYE